MNQRRQWKIMILSSFFFFLAHSAGITDGHTDCTIVPILKTGESIRLDCDDAAMSGNKWKHEDDLLFANDNAISSKFAQSMESCANYSLIIDPATKEHEGRYVCIRNSHILVQYCLEFQTAPNMRIGLRGGSNSTVITVDSGSGLALFCHALSAMPKVHLTLMVNNKAVEIDEVVHDSAMTNDFDQPTFDTIATTTYQPDEGMQHVTCFTRGQFRVTTIEAFFTVLRSAIPDVFVTINGRELDEVNDHHFEEGKEIVLECNAFSETPLVNLTWKFSNGDTTSALTNFSSSRYVHENQTYHEQIVLKHRPCSEQENFTCIGKSEGPTETTSVSVHYFTYVPPVLQIFADGENIESVLSVSRGKELQLRCLANGSRPLVNLQIISSNTEIFAELRTSFRKHVTHIDVKFRVNEPNTSITCLSTSPIIGQERSKTIFIKMTNQESVSTADKHVSKVILSVGLACLAMLVNIACFGILLSFKLLKKRSRPRKALNATNLFLSQRTTANDASYSESPLPCHMEGIRSKHHPIGAMLVKSVQDGPNQLSLDDEDCYSMLGEKQQDCKMFHLKDIRIIFNMKKGSVFSRRVGMLNERNCSARCVVLSTIGDERQDAIGINWSSYVQRLLELPDTESLVKTEGICIGDATLFLITEYVACGTLDEYITSKGPTDDLVLKTSNRFTNVLEVLCGIEVLHSYGFLHPGLSLDRILVSDSGKMKLYDFCLTEDAPGILLIKKEKYMSKDKSLLPPEALSRNEYSSASDVWSVAMIIADMMAKGFLPCSRSRDPFYTPKDELYEGWYLNSETCNEKILFRDLAFSKCWSNECSERPTIRELRLQLEKVSTIFSDQEAVSNSTSIDLHTPTKSCDA